MSYRESHTLQDASEYDRSLEEGGMSRYMWVRESEIVPALVEKYFPNGINRYLDFACGTGRILSLIAPYCSKVVAVDVSEPMLAGAREKVPTAQFVVDDLTKRDCDLSPFDLISAFRFFGNAEDGLRRDVIRTLHGLLSPNGLLLTNNHRNPRSLHRRLRRSHDAMDLDNDKFRHLLQQSGFRVVQSTSIGAWVIRSKWFDARYWSSPTGVWLDRIFSPSVFAPLAVDCILVAKRK